MKHLLCRVWKGQRGLTLLELTVVAAILSVLAGLTAAAVTGSASQSRQVVQTADEAEIQKAVDRFNGEHRKSLYPTINGCLPGQTFDTTANTCSGSSITVTFDEDEPSTWTENGADTWEAIIWDKALKDLDGDLLYFVDDFLAKVPQGGKLHTDGSKWTITGYSDPNGVVSDGLDVPDNTGYQDTPAGTSTKVAVYVLDKDGDVHVIEPSGGF